MAQTSRPREIVRSNATGLVRLRVMPQDATNLPPAALTPGRQRRILLAREGSMRRSSLRASWPAAAGLVLLASSCAPPPATPADRGPAQPVVEYVTRQEILTALPLRVRLPERYGAERVLVFVRLRGTHNWAQLELGRAGQTWAGEVSCRAVSTITGDTRYFFLALDAEGSAVVSSGSPEWPHVATIVGNLPDGPRALAGQPAPLRCHDPADCPPDFPGCPPYVVARPACGGDRDCPRGLRCAWDGYCDGAPMAIDDTTSEDEALARLVRKATRKYRTVAAGPVRR
jgi:hypothetical protein